MANVSNRPWAFVVLSLLGLSHYAHSFSYQGAVRPRSWLRRNSKSPSVETSVDESPSLKTSQFVVALTREKGKNEKLRKALLSNEILGSSKFNIDIHEIPCIEHADATDTQKLGPTLSSTKFDYVAITSPEAAKVFASAWVDVGCPEIGVVAAVGKATGDTLKKFGVDVGFVPTKATAETLVNELPLSDSAQNEGRDTTLLYPASAKAQDTLQHGLENRGFVVTRLNTYDTVPASWTDDQLRLAAAANVACFASPSAVKAWLKNTANIDTPRAIAACIGETSASACRKNEWEENKIFYPDKPGIDGWTTAVLEALSSISLN